MAEAAPTTYRNLTPAEAKGLMEDMPEGAYDLLDVRQDWEYEEFHLPGARWVPLAELPARLQELEPDKPVLVYCAAGRRSAAAASLLAGQGFADVRNILGGAMAWRGLTAAGPASLGLVYFRGDETVADILRLAYRMEGTLADLYEHLAAGAATPEVASLLGTLASMELGHQRLVFDAYVQATSSGQDQAEFEHGLTFDVLEGAVSADHFLAERAEDLKTVFGVIDTAMAIEAQAMDLYLRARRLESDEPVRAILAELAEAEKNHITDLARVLDRRRK